MYSKLKNSLAEELKKIREGGLYKDERIIVTPQGADIKVQDGREVINFCANNYLGLSGHPDLIKACREGLEKHGFGMSSVRFICGTQDIHKELERQISKICRKLARKKAEEELKENVKLNRKNLKKYLGVEKFDSHEDIKNDIGFF